MPEASELLSLTMAQTRDEQAICYAARRLSVVHPQAAPVVTRLSLSPEEIQRKWDCNREEAARFGSWMPFIFEAGRGFVISPRVCIVIDTRMTSPRGLKFLIGSTHIPAHTSTFQPQGPGTTYIIH